MKSFEIIDDSNFANMSYGWTKNLKSFEIKNQAINYGFLVGMN